MEKTNYDTNLKLVTPANHVITASGKIVNLFNPDPNTLWIKDIAHGLAHTCRWNGHTKSFYSVAEHCVRVADRLPKEKKLTGLLHDAEEAYFGDIISPIKNILPSDIIEKIINFREVIFKKYNVPPIDDEVDAADKAEMYWDYENTVTNMKYVGLHPLKAKTLWLAKLNLLTDKNIQ
jgi:hypothetical protein